MSLGNLCFPATGLEVDITLGTFTLPFEGSSKSESDSALDANSAVLALVSVEGVAGAEDVVAAFGIG